MEIRPFYERVLASLIAANSNKAQKQKNTTMANPEKSLSPHKVAVLYYLIALLLSVAPSQIFTNLPFTKVIVELLKVWPPAEQASHQLARYGPSYADKYMLCYAFLTAFAVAMSVVYGGVAFCSARKGRNTISIGSGNQVGWVSGAAMMCLSLLQVLWIVKLPNGRTFSALQNESLIWLGAFYSVVAFGNWLGRRKYLIELSRQLKGNAAYQTETVK